MPSTTQYFKKSFGFSLIEMMMMLALFSVVSIPMIMALNNQEKALIQSQGSTVGGVLEDTLFDAIDPYAQDAVTRFTVGTATANPTTSVYCDPGAVFTGNQCTKGPFFRRILTLSNNNLTATISLADDSNGTINKTISRTYHLAAYRIYPESAAVIPTTPPVLKVYADVMGNSWYPAYQQGTNHAFGVLSGCSATATDTVGTNTGVSYWASNKHYFPLNATGCTFRFNVTPNHKYTARLIFYNATTGNAPSDNSLTSGLSANTTSVDFTTTTGSTTTLIKQFKDFDVAAALNYQQQYYPLDVSIDTTANTTLDITVKSANSTTNTNLAGIELIEVN